ncbi:hypothetical protein [Pelistega suis]|uniref:hypothetical protein n=1 Tax=Pelistega suis TaxID=1631957 RepID=UPI00211B81A2|nr:hypothetical protein [Pelistega suis]MCQ9328053.1 hypothetical protein [Pelistega suis]
MISFLEKELQDNHIMLYASTNSLFLSSVFVSNDSLSQDSMQHLLDWNGNPYTSWSIDTYHNRYKLYAPKLPFHNSIEGEHIVFARQFEGDNDLKSYYEINQKITLALDLHHIPERKAWCRLNELGDIEDTIKKIIISPNETEKMIIIYACKKHLASYAAATNQSLLRMIDITAISDNFCNWINISSSEINTSLTQGTLNLDIPNGSYFRGIQLIDLATYGNTALQQQQSQPPQYVDFIVQDFKYNKISTVSCNPDAFDNYFVDTGKPYGMSPAFFKPEVLRKYKSDTEKYTINERMIHCRGAWSLRSFDINEAGQISAYLIDLSHLPYQEQLYWKTYNEPPQANISEQAYKTDFMGEFADKILPLNELKNFLLKISSNNLSWWKLRNENIIAKLQYPLTESKDEWAEELLTLDQLIVEGFEEKWLKTRAKQLNPNIDSTLRSLKLIEKILITKNIEPENASQIMSIFHDIHNLRSEMKGHIYGETAEKKRKDIIATYGSYRKHFDHLVSRTLSSLKILVDTLEYN